MTDNALFRSIFKNAPVGFAVVGKAGALIEVNHMLCLIWQRREEELLKLRWQDLTHPEDIEGDEIRVQEVIEGKRTHYTLRKRYLAPDGSHIPAILSVFTGGPEDGCYLVAMVQDLSPNRASQIANIERARAISEASHQVKKLREILEARNNA